jgi:L-iditol 2-dehydrogenase
MTAAEAVVKLAPGPGQVGLAHRPRRAVDPGYVALRVEAAGVCGTDLHIEAGEYPSCPPVTMGHEVCGVAAELGPGVDSAWDSVRVVSETYYSTCGHCPLCRAGRPNLCGARRSIGTHVDGAFAPRVVVPAHGLHRVPDGLGPPAAALTEPLACVSQSLLDPPVVATGDRVLVLGPGAIGLLAAQVARAGGGSVAIQGAPRDVARLDLARELGFATRVAGEEIADGFDLVVECSGSATGIAQALGAARRGGRIVQIGLRGAPVTIDWDLICFHELVVTSGFASTPTSWRRALALLAAGAVQTAPLVSEVLPLALGARLRRVAQRRGRQGGADAVSAQASSTSKETSRA